MGAIKAIFYEDIDVPDELSRTSIKLTDCLAKKLATGYSPDPKAEFYAEMALAQQLEYILWGVSGYVKGKTILDLGCGCNYPAFESEGGPWDSMYEPWLCRGLHLLGANPIGVDYDALSGEKFKHYEVDLTASDSLSMIPDESVDLANARQLFSSVWLGRRGKNSEDLRRNIHTQLERILKPRAFLLYWD
ncbi:hypothetical protein KY347_00030 [Candidatus Woesearchaeota archaeon]|nr:hypothetical protein [Candidatus Woesearchaeota archaeon]